MVRCVRPCSSSSASGWWRGGVADRPGVDGGVLPGIALVVVGLLVKVAGFLLGDPPSSRRRAGGRRLSQAAASSGPRAGIPVGRASVRRRIPAPGGEHDPAARRVAPSVTWPRRSRSTAIAGRPDVRFGPHRMTGSRDVTSWEYATLEISAGPAVHGQPRPGGEQPRHRRVAGLRDRSEGRAALRGVPALQRAVDPAVRRAPQPPRARRLGAGRSSAGRTTRSTRPGTCTPRARTRRSSRAASSCAARPEPDAARVVVAVVSRGSRPPRRRSSRASSGSRRPRSTPAAACRPAP